jgi:hypothetical protein
LANINAASSIVFKIRGVWFAASSMHHVPDTTLALKSVPFLLLGHVVSPEGDWSSGGPLLQGRSAAPLYTGRSY